MTLLNSTLLVIYASASSGDSIMRSLLSSAFLFLGLVCLVYFGLKGSAQRQQKREQKQQSPADETTDD